MTSENIDFDKAYRSRGESVHDFFGRTEEGFFIPAYQREYTWEAENIRQLFDDLVSGIRELSNNDNKSITFLGTIILTSHTNKLETVIPGEDRAQPTDVKIVIDGQQRISTLALLAIQIVERLKFYRSQLPDDKQYDVLRDHCDHLCNTRLPKLFGIKLERGSKPPIKPKIIRAVEDHWTYDGPDTAYDSPIARYIATYLSFQNTQITLNGTEPVCNDRRIRENVELINERLNAICNAHIPNTPLYEHFPSGQLINTERMQEYVLDHRNNNLANLVIDAAERREKDDAITATYHLFVLVYYLLHRSCINCLNPEHEEWGFDMFQALNATGTPLTAMETFLPQVIQAERASGNNWEATPSYAYFNEVNILFDNTTGNEQKDRLTNDLLRTVALCYAGETLSNRFSAQRRWMSRIYNGYQTIEEKRSFMKCLGDTARFYRRAWYMHEVDDDRYINGLESHNKRELSSMLVQYLKSAGSALSIPILARFYGQIFDDRQNIDEFVEATKACAAFFTLWRAASSTLKLDDIYRNFFSGNNGPVTIAKHSWKAHPEPVSAQTLKQYFLDVLTEKGLHDKETWMNTSDHFLLFTEIQTVCRFALFVAGHDRIPNPDVPGLLLQGNSGVCPLLSLSQWTSKDYKSLEHVAPQSTPDQHRWDPTIYTENKIHDIGNLILLPRDINALVDNKSWMVKYLHYSHVGERNPEVTRRLEEEARRNGVILSKRAVKALQTTKYNCAVEPILNLGINGIWDAGLIDRRTKQIKEIIFGELIGWLE